MNDGEQYIDLEREVVEFLLNMPSEKVGHIDMVTAAFMYPEEVANQLYSVLGARLLAHEAFICGMRWQLHLDAKRDDSTNRLLNDVNLE